MTVIAVVRYDVMPRRLVKLIRINRRPYPVMIKMMNREVQRYQAVGCHDKTGLGNVVSDFLDFHDSVEGFVMVGRARTQLLLDYITSVENNIYQLPVDRTDDYLMSLKRAHRATTVADVYAPGKWNSHLPDEIAAMALAHRACEKRPVPITEGFEMPKEAHRRSIDRAFDNGDQDELPASWRREGDPHTKDEGGSTAMDLLWTP